jgi:hypothetical protein
VKHWRDDLLRTCEVAQGRKSVEFSKILELKGTKRLWFSRKSAYLHDPIRIHGSDILAEANVNADGLDGLAGM